MRPVRRPLVIAAAAVLALVTAKIVAGDLATLHRRAQAPDTSVAPVTTTSSTAPGADIPAGMRAVRVRVEPPWALPPGAVVDLLATFDGPGVAGGRAAVVVARGAVVLSRPSPPREQDSRSGENGGEVTLLVTVETARRVASAAAAGPLAVALAPPEDACCTKSPSASSRG